MWLMLGLLLTMLAPAASTLAQDAQAPQLGFHVGAGDAAHMWAVQRAGGEFAVVVFSWEDIEPTPNYLYWEQPDAALRAAEFHDVGIVARLDRPPTWALSDSDPTPWRLDAYANFVRRVVERYGDRLDGVIIWNEPNLQLEWHGETPDPAAYVEMLRIVYPVVKAHNPDLPVLMAGLAFTEGDGATAMNDLTYLRRFYAAGGADYFDIMAMHPYGFGRPPDDAPAPDRLNFRRLELHRTIMDAHGDGDKAVWITEMGWRTSAPDPADEWQVVTTQQQATYSLRALSLAAAEYPWLERMAFWELNERVDAYGYALWQGPEETAPAYQRLVELADARPTEARAAREPADAPAPVVILAPDVIIRLGDIGTLHPHWVHLYRGEQGASLRWQGEFFLTPAQAQRSYDLLMETMQIDQPTNQLSINDHPLAALAARPHPDPTSTWVTQRFTVSASMLRPGVNTLTVESGLRNPALQYRWWRWENLQFRHVRLVQPADDSVPMWPDWEPASAPSGWAEINRLRPGGSHGGTALLWATANRPGQLWRAVQSRTANDGAQVAPLETQSGDADLVFVDILDAAMGQLAATSTGLYWRESGGDWRAVTGGPHAHAFVVARSAEVYLAGFEDAGLWEADAIQGPWRPSASTVAADPGEESPAYTVLDIATTQRGVHYIATDRGVFARSWMRTRQLPEIRGTSAIQRREATDEDFVSRLYLGRNDELIARYNDRLWLWEDETGWRLLAPGLDDAPQRLVLNCCGTGTIVGLEHAGLWQQQDDGEWRRIDGEFFTDLSLVDALQIGDVVYLATTNGIYYADATAGVDALTQATWTKMPGLPSNISDLVVDPADGARWLAGTPAGLYRSEDSGASWASISPPWRVWDLAFGADGRLYVARADGVAWSDDPAADPVPWRVAEGMESVNFFRVRPSPHDGQRVWGGTWGNNVGVSQDGAATMRPLHNGLETLSALDILWHPTPGQVTLATIEGLYRSDDDGQSWFKLPGALRNQTVYSLLQSDAGAMWAGAADGLWVSRDYGVEWQRMDSVPVVTVARVGQLRGPDGAVWLWAGTEGGGLWVSRDGGVTWRFGGLAGRTVYNLLVDPVESERLIAATDVGVFVVDVPGLW
jgi:hypothetical protein